MKVLFLSRGDADPKALASARDRVSRMEAALAGVGFEAEHRAVRNLQDLRAALESGSPDLVFSLAHRVDSGAGGEAEVHRELERLGLPFVGSDADAIETALSKEALKKAMVAKGIATPRYFTAGRSAAGEIFGFDKALSAIAFPYIVKPEREGNSRGIGGDSVTRDRSSLHAKLMEVLNRYGGAIVEAYLGDAPDFQEFTVATIGAGAARLAMPASLGFAEGSGRSGPITTGDKDGGLTAARSVPAGPLRERLADFARAMCDAARARDYARCDVILAEGRLWAIEINGQPMVPDRWFGACAAGAGMDEAGYVRAIFLAALARLEREGAPGIGIPEGLRAGLPAEIAEALAGGGEAGAEGGAA